MKKFKEFINEKYLSDEEIEEGYDNYKITEFKVYNFSEDGGASGMIAIEFPEIESEDWYKVDNWIKYDSGPRIAFDYWYPPKMNQELKDYIEKGIKKERLKRAEKKYNL